MRLIRWFVTAWVIELPELQIAWNSCQNSIASPAMTLGCFVDCSKTLLFLPFQIIQDSIMDCSTVLSQPSSNTGQIILTKSRNSCSNYLFSAAPNSCASSQFHNSCIMSFSFNLQLGHHGYVRTLLFNRLAHAGRMLWHALHANILTLLGTFAFQIEHQTISTAILLDLPIPIEHIPSCTFLFFIFYF